ncbi:hypothetical protein RchiOBHm_Chr6g0265371 [Rosa chinensis]|uniref:Uncharacterized protein n=1 Tax=Rosa chinensis TaxID=74649 RepID=A0A2P6PPF1_ROSCH|nr:hypothetical protein RchiOBHm_Chr6g0265371 [Rosa chinensis]
MWSLATNQIMIVALHDAPIRDMAGMPELNLLVTRSLDKTVKGFHNII